ncbi:hypothetical protein Aperf_G00000022902 [Anoplocephala perfoliata]
MSGDNSPNIVTSEDESVLPNNLLKRKIGGDQESRSVESQTKRFAGSGLVSYDVDHDDEDSQSDLDFSVTVSEAEADESNISINGGHLPFMSIDGGPVTVLSLEHIEAAHESPAVLNDEAQSVLNAEPMVEKDKLSPNRISPSKEETDVDKGATEVTLPPEPTEMCSMELLNKVETTVRRMQHDISFDPNRMIQDNKSFRNPSIYKKLVSYLGIDEKGSNFSKDVYDPYRWDANSYYDKLAEIQNREVERLEKLQKERRKAEANAVQGPAGASASNNRAASGSSLEVKKKSKWDAAGPVESSQLPPPKVADSITANKVTIPAIGDLFHKK